MSSVVRSFVAPLAGTLFIVASAVFLVVMVVGGAEYRPRAAAAVAVAPVAPEAAWARLTDPTGPWVPPGAVLRVNHGRRVLSAREDHPEWGWRYGRPCYREWTWSIAPAPGGGAEIRLHKKEWIVNPIAATRERLYSPFVGPERELRAFVTALGADPERVLP